MAEDERTGGVRLQGVVVIGATNRPTLLDPALLRPGRLDELVYVPVPDRAARLRILRVQTRDMPLAADVDLERLAAGTERYTGADLADLVRRAGLQALREDIQATAVPMRLFETALDETRPSVTDEMEREYEQIAERLKQESPSGVRRIGFIVDSDDGEPGERIAARAPGRPRARSRREGAGA